jgi:hypothetical protein
MIFDAQNLFSNKQAITATANSTNVIDLGLTGIPYGNVERMKRDIGKGKKIPLRVQVTETFATLTSLTITVVTSDVEALNSGNLTHYTTVAIPAADLVAGYTVEMDVVPMAQKAGMKRYMGLIYTVGGSNATAGRVMAGITMGNQTNDTI